MGGFSKPTVDDIRMAAGLGFEKAKKLLDEMAAKEELHKVRAAREAYRMRMVKRIIELGYTPRLLTMSRLHSKSQAQLTAIGKALNVLVAEMEKCNIRQDGYMVKDGWDEF